ncbi:MAG: YfaP family protein, partial [Candidatus Poseidoniaceae archaeon]
MDTGSILVLSILGGGFILGVWFILIRRDAALEVRQGMVADGLKAPVRGSSFSSARSEFERKLVMIEAERRRRNLSGGSISLIQQEQEQPAEPFWEEEPPVVEPEPPVEEEDDDEESEEEMLERRRQRDEEWARREEEEERRRLEEEEAALAEQQERLKKEQEEQAEKERLEAEKAAEEARLAAERDAAAQAERDAEEAARQAELAAAEEQRLAEIRAAQEKDALERRQAASRALEELRARLEREGARSSDVQVSLMWNNYNDLDLHVVCPSGERIHGGNKTSACGGELDVDANVRAETRKPVENVFWEEGKAPAGRYQVYVHYYKKHKKRRSKDPTKFQVIVNQGGDPREYNGELSMGDPIMLVAEFTLATPEERAARRRELEEELRAAGMDVPETQAAIAEVEEARQAEIEAAEAERLA